MNSNFAFRLVFALLMSLLMTALMSGWVTWLNIGLAPDFLTRWGYAFRNAWPAAFLVVLFAAPWVQRLTGRLVQWQPAALPRVAENEES
jgi:hypothetical protein